MPFYAHCRNCGLDFESRFFFATNSTNGTISGGREPCTGCGEMAELMEGVFDFDMQGTPKMLAGPGWSQELLERMAARFREIEEVAESSDLSDDEARAKVDQILAEIRESNPEVAAEYSRLEEPNNRKSWATAAKSVGVTILAGVGAVESLAALSERIYRTWVSLTGG